MKTSRIEELYRIIASPLVKYPDELLVHTQTTGDAYTVVAACNSEDKGRLIGSGGRMFKACEYLIRTAGRNIGVSTRLIIESDFRTTHKLCPFAPKYNWNKTDNEYLEALIWDVLGYVGVDPAEVRTSDVSKWGTVVVVRTTDSLEEQMRLALETVINAIGKAKGRFVYLDIGWMYEGQRTNFCSR